MGHGHHGPGRRGPARAPDGHAPVGQVDDPRHPTITRDRVTDEGQRFQSGPSGQRAFAEGLEGVIVQHHVLEFGGGMEDAFRQRLDLVA